MDSGVYDIDYRGPETHSYIPPPNRSGTITSLLFMVKAPWRIANPKVSELEIMEEVIRKVMDEEVFGNEVCVLLWLKLYCYNGREWDDSLQSKEQIETNLLMQKYEGQPSERAQHWLILSLIRLPPKAKSSNPSHRSFNSSIKSASSMVSRKLSLKAQKGVFSPGSDGSVFSVQLEKNRAQHCRVISEDDEA
ncbi:hypothetical protein LOK49_LG05G00628 [Camellia lanceoleosa]|uniref:Uncharacterized protein n=1 Tax=Camellia lanceoleosa TaxID=1840588 RepID=A0ACC0HK05_9ERIC|nr:hypothetical protein LOK49_LG05G00628 [Camellia lanceoleosa]